MLNQATDTKNNQGKHYPEWLRGLADFFGVKLSGDNVKSVGIHDKAQAFTKTPLGAMAFASSSSDVSIEYNTEAQNALAGVQNEIEDAKKEIEGEMQNT